MYVMSYDVNCIFGSVKYSPAEPHFDTDPSLKIACKGTG